MFGILKRITVCCTLSMAAAMACAQAWSSPYDHSKASFTPSTHGSYRERDINDLQVFESVEDFQTKANFSFRVIGSIDAYGMAGGTESLEQQLDLIEQIRKLARPVTSEVEDIELAMRALKKEAARVGATGVVILSTKQVQLAQSASSYRHILAIAILRQ